MGEREGLDEGIRPYEGWSHLQLERALSEALEREAELLQFVRDARPLLGIGYGQSLGGRADRLLAPAPPEGRK